MILCNNCKKSKLEGSAQTTLDLVCTDPSIGIVKTDYGTGHISYRPCSWLNVKGECSYYEPGIKTKILELFGR